MKPKQYTEDRPCVSAPLHGEALLLSPPLLECPPHVSALTTAVRGLGHLCSANYTYNTLQQA